jgi:hypothetical protein
LMGCVQTMIDVEDGRLFLFFPYRHSVTARSAMRVFSSSHLLSRSTLHLAACYRIH